MENENKLKFFFWIGTAIMLLCVLGIILIITLYRNKVYKIHKKESDNLLNASLNTEKKERQRIASDLHDCVSGDLMAMKNYVAILLRQENNDFHKKIFLEIKSTLGITLENIENISYNLMPPTLEYLGLVSTFKSYFDRVRKWNEIIINEKYYSENINIDSSASYELFRIIQELVNNATKHGNADIIDFEIKEKGNYLLFKIVDNGASFNFKKSTNESNGMGLKNITSRIKHINAELKQIEAHQGNIIVIYLKYNP